MTTAFGKLDQANSGKTHENGFMQNSDEKQKEHRKNVLTSKVFKHRNSILTDLMEVNHLRGVHNIAVAACTLLIINTVAYYVVSPEGFREHSEFIAYNTSKMSMFLKLWVGYHIYMFAVHTSFKWWIYARNRFFKKITDIFFLLSYIASAIMMFVITTKAIRSNDVPPLTGFIIVCEQVRLFMKAHSFVRENVPRVLRYKPDKDGKQEHALCPTLQQFVYFLFIPAFIYRDTYPRTKEIRWSFVLSNLMRFCGCVFILYCLYLRFYVHVFRNAGHKLFTVPEAILIYAEAMAVGSSVMFLGFYGLLHCWLNAFAEMLRFGDRQFYQDWWNSDSFSQYYRKWNLVVSDWLYAYVHSDIHQIGLPRSVSMIMTFLLSALVHEYLISVAVGYFFPFLMIIYSTIGIPLAFFKKMSSNVFNVFMWVMLFSGWGFLITFYCIEWYARQNCPRVLDLTLDNFLPRSWTETCQIIALS